MKDTQKNNSLNIVDKPSLSSMVQREITKLIDYHCEPENLIRLTVDFAEENRNRLDQVSKELNNYWVIIRDNVQVTLFCNHDYSLSKMSTDMVASVMLDHYGLFPFLLFIVNRIEGGEENKKISFKGLLTEDWQRGLLCVKVSECSILDQKRFNESIKKAVDHLKMDKLSFELNLFSTWLKNNIENPMIFGKDEDLKEISEPGMESACKATVPMDVLDYYPSQVENNSRHTRGRALPDQDFPVFNDEELFASYPALQRAAPIKRPPRTMAPQNKTSGYSAVRGVEILNDWSFKFLSDTGAFKSIEPSQLFVIEGASINCVNSKIFHRFKAGNNTNIYVFDMRTKEISDREKTIMLSLSNGETAVCLINNGDSIGDKCQPFVTEHIKFPQTSNWLVGLLERLWKPEYGENIQVFVDRLEKACDVTLTPEYDTVVLNWLVIDDWWLEGKEQYLARAIKVKNVLISKNDLPSVKILDQICDGEKAEVKKWQVLLQPLRLQGKTDPDQIYRNLQQEFPWMQAANEILARSAAICNWSKQGYYKLGKPIMIMGRPGIGKTRWAYRVADILGLDISALQASGVASSMSLLGAERGWSTAHPSFPARAMWNTKTANPLLFIDEIDKVADGNQNGSVVEALIPMLEKISSKRYPDNFLQGNLNLSYCSWLFTVNSIAGISQTLMDRVVLVKVNAPLAQHFETIRLGILKDLAEEFGIMVEDLPDISNESEVHKRIYLENLSVRSLQENIRQSINKHFWQPPKPKLVTNTSANGKLE